MGSVHKAPFLQETVNSKQLIVNGKPYLMLAAELQNSSLTSAAFMRAEWQKLVDTNINTVLGCVTWEMIEPEEGKFDFSELDQVIKDARSFGLHLVLLWFGSFKNGLSTYAPGWVKKDVQRFPRAHLRKAGGRLQTTECVSIFHEEAPKADQKAFSTLMRHLKEIDEAHSTVLMIQVENEIGLLGDSRDGSSTANKIFNSAVPAQLVSYISEHWDSLHPDLRENIAAFKAHGEPVTGTWEQVFGKGLHTDELFMAYHYAIYVERVASAGKAEYSIPMYTNVWQNYVSSNADKNFPIVAGGGGDPGDYPSGGSVTGVLDVWKGFAPSLDFISPDVYLNDYTSSCANYRHLGQPLFIPEQRRDEYGARRVWTAYGTYAAIGVSPFGIDTLEPKTNPYTKHYGLLASVAPIILEAQRNPGSSFGFHFDELKEDGTDPSPPVTVKFSNYEILIERCFVFGKPGAGAGVVIQKNPSTFLLIGWGFQCTFKSLSERATFSGILRFEEKEIVNKETGELRTLRVLNGDETRSGAFAMMPNEEPDYGGFPICVTVPAKTMIAECEAYALEEDESVM